MTLLCTLPSSPQGNKMHVFVCPACAHRSTLRTTTSHQKPPLLNTPAADTPRQGLRFWGSVSFKAGRARVAPKVNQCPMQLI